MKKTGSGSIGGILRVVESTHKREGAWGPGGAGGAGKIWRRLGRAGQVAAVVGSAGTVGTLVAAGLGARGVGPLRGLSSLVAKRVARDSRRAKQIQEMKVAWVDWQVLGVLTDDPAEGEKCALGKSLDAYSSRDTEDGDSYATKTRSGAANHGLGLLAELFREMLVYIVKSAAAAPNGTVISDLSVGGSEDQCKDYVAFRFSLTRDMPNGPARTRLRVSPVLAHEHGATRSVGHHAYAARELHAAFESFRREYGAENYTWNVIVCVAPDEFDVYQRAFEDAAQVVTYSGDEWADAVDPARPPSSLQLSAIKKARSTSVLIAIPVLSERA
jgi:hypothetical protein